MRVGIVTITELDNYGNRLQNYALQETIKSLGAEVETIPNFIIYGYRKSRKYQLKTFMHALRVRNRIQFCTVLKQKRFEKFDKKHFAFSKYFSDIRFISPELDENYDLFIAGSDQIWNPHFPFNLDFNFLTFAQPHKRIAYSASFGVDSVPEEKNADFQRYLAGMKKISVREFQGQTIVKELTGEDVPVLLDPTLLRTREQWEALQKRPKWVKQDTAYILTYYLGKREELQQTLHKVYETNPNYNGLPAIHLNDYQSIQRFCATPDEFIWLINHAKLMVTDSFHGTVFSMLLQTPFVIVKRDDSGKSMFSRLSSLFQLLRLTPSEGVVREHIDNYTAFEKTLSVKRAEAMQYLKDVLKTAD